MTTLEQAAVAHLATAAITRVYPSALPEGVTYPAHSYQRISAPREQSFRRTVQSTRVRLQFDTWGSTHASVQSAADALRAALLTFTTSPVKGLVFDTDLHDYDPETGLYRVTTDVLVLIAGDG